MESFQLAEDAILDIDAIWLFLLHREGLDRADRVVTELFQSFDLLAEIPNSGHRRRDLTDQDVLFYKIFSYLIIYRLASRPLHILAVLHGKRNVGRILRQR